MRDMDKELPPSELGTKEYWDSTYTRELKTFEETGDSGEVWFSLQCQHRIVAWLKRQSKVSSRDATILDIGCGNGALLIELAEEGFEKLTGVDYCSEAVELAKQVATTELESSRIEFLVADILALDSSPLKGRTFDVCLDKGTYDAISLSPSEAGRKRVCYIESVAALLSAGGLLVITSCNWTAEELKAQFGQISELLVQATIPAPSFQFGGSTGQTVSTVVFQKP